MLKKWNFSWLEFEGRGATLPKLFNFLIVVYKGF
jgi:hypothetical protein